MKQMQLKTMIKDVETNDIEFYGNQIVDMEETMYHALYDISTMELNEIDYAKARIKTAESMQDKLRKRNLMPIRENALEEIRDAIGIRIVCNTIDDIYEIRDGIREKFEIVKEKDYVKFPRSGYKSYHMIVKYEGFFIEIQIRTFIMDMKANLTHKMIYKQEFANQPFVEKQYIISTEN